MILVQSRQGVNWFFLFSNRGFGLYTEAIVYHVYYIRNDSLLDIIIIVSNKLSNSRSSYRTSFAVRESA